MVDPATPAPVCTRPAAQGRTRRKGEVALPRSPFGVHRPASTGHAHPGTAAADPAIYALVRSPHTAVSSSSSAAAVRSISAHASST